MIRGMKQRLDALRARLEFRTFIPLFSNAAGEGAGEHALQGAWDSAEPFLHLTAAVVRWGTGCALTNKKGRHNQ